MTHIVEKMIRQGSPNDIDHEELSNELRVIDIKDTRALKNYTFLGIWI